jgi:response regulator NasT
MKHNILLLELTSQPREVLTKVLTQCGYVVRSCNQASDIPSYLSSISVDFIIINANVPHPSLLKQLKAALCQHSVPAVLFTKSSDKSLTEEAIQSGISALIVDGFSIHRIKHILDSTRAQFSETQRLKSEIRKLKIQLMDRKTIDKAKGILMKRRAIDESTAFGLIRKMAVDRNQNLAQVAANIIDVDELLV